MRHDHAPKDRLIQELLSRRDFTSAKPLIDAQLQENPEHSDYRYYLGVYHYFRGSLGESIVELEKSLKSNPRNTDAAICLSVLFNDIGRYADAKRVFEQANQSITDPLIGGRDQLEIDRKFAIKHLELADLYFRYKRFDEAIEEYSKAALLNPTSVDIRIKRAKALSKKGYVTRAVQELQQLKSTFPKYATLGIQLGLLHFSQNNYIEAESEWTSVLGYEPENREALTYLELLKKKISGNTAH